MQAVLSFKLPAVIIKGENFYVSTCPVLDVSSQGKTKKEALENLKEALALFLKSCFERGTIDQVLKESQFKALHLKHFKPKKYAPKYTAINVPLPFKIPAPEATLCPA